MKALAKLYLALAVIGLASLAPRSNAEPMVVPLVAGQRTYIGHVTVRNVGNSLIVMYQTDGWGMSAVHLYVGTKPPKKSAPGQFSYQAVLHNATRWVKVIDDITLPPLSWEAGPLYIAAHADVCGGQQAADYALTAAEIPTTGTLSMVNYNLATAYMNLTPTGFPTFKSWCINEGIPLKANVFLPTAFEPGLNADGTVNTAIPFTSSAVTFAEATGSSLVNLLTYLLNTDYVKTCGAGGPYNAAEIQYAIWYITNLWPTDYWPELADPENVAAILWDVALHGPFFVAQPGELVAVFADPLLVGANGTVVGHSQPLMFGVELRGTTTSGGCETAWALAPNGISWPKGTGWGTYFEYNP